MRKLWSWHVRNLENKEAGSRLKNSEGKRLDGRNPHGWTQRKNWIRVDPTEGREAGATWRGSHHVVSYKGWGPAGVKGHAELSTRSGSRWTSCAGTRRASLRSARSVPSSLRRIHRYPEAERRHLSTCLHHRTLDPDYTLHQLIDHFWALIPPLGLLIAKGQPRSNTVREEEWKDKAEKRRSIHLPTRGLPVPS